MLTNCLAGGPSGFVQQIVSRLHSHPWRRL